MIKVLPEHEAAGITLWGCTGYSVEGNNVSTNAVNHNKTTIGIAVVSSGEYPNEIYRNTLSNLGVGLYSAGTNADESPTDPGVDPYTYGLQWKCNTLLPKDMTVADIFLRSGSLDEDQGSCIGGVTSPAGNKFSHSHLGTGSTHWDFRAVTSAMALGLEINYRYHAGSGSPSSMEPTKYTGMGSSGGTIFHPDPCAITYTVSGCPVKNTVFPIKVAGIVAPPPEEMYAFEDVTNMQQQANVFNQMAGPGLSTSMPAGITASEFETMTTSIASDAYLAEIEFWRSIHKAYQNDTTGSFPAAEFKYMLDTYQPAVLERLSASISSSFQLTPSMWSSAAYSPQSSDNSVLGIGTAILPDTIDSEFFEQHYLLPYDAAQLHAAYMSAGKSYTPVLNLEGLYDFGGKSNSPQANDRPEESESVTIQPNPFKDKFSLNIPAQQGEAEYLTVTVYDAAGKMVYRNEVDNVAGVYQISLSGNAAGIFYYKITSGTVIVDQGKLIKEK